MMDTRRNITLLGGSALALSLALSGCTTAEPAASTTTAIETPSSSPSATPEESASVGIVREYLAAIVAEDSASAWALLTPEAQSFYGGDPEVYASWFANDGVTSPEEASAFADVDVTETEGPEGAFTLVSAQTETAADAWIVRETDTGPLIDDAGIPTTGGSLYEWRNPSSGAEDSSESGAFDLQQPASLFFASPQSFDSDTPSTIGYPDTVWAYVDGDEVPAELGPASDAGRVFEVTSDTLPADGAPHALTIVWQVGEDSLGWRSTTTLLVP
ncbi:hypothetical protein [Labedella endophytica]|uniref:Uncharacterized protein n=1 Tax=Labedella endophytica TaxID=1523160 RepID=A0A433JTG7_9MICO|nr:hypothetical protein [Labedella endophytica]RUR01623.1 hypothetical protein ELQ94_09085 [Labedella endophytica]